MQKINYDFKDFANIQSIDADINAIVMAHNTEWVPFLMCSKDNALKFHLEIRGSSLFYLKQSSIPYDLILIYSNDFYNEQVLLDLKDETKKISLFNNKKVIFGYSSFIPYEKRKGNVYDINICSFQSGIEMDSYSIDLDSSKIRAIDTLYMMYEFYLDKPNIKKKKKS